MNNLTAKQQKFVNEYLVDLNATQAAIRAGYSKKTAGSIGEENLKKPEIQSVIEKRMKEREKRTEITQDKVIAELAKIAFADQRNVMTWGSSGVKLKDSDSLSDDDAAIVSEVSESFTATGGTLKLKTHDKVKALELLGRHLGIFTENLNVNHSGSIENLDLSQLSDADLKTYAALQRKIEGKT